MTLQIAFLLVVLVAMVVLFLTEWLPVEVTALAALAILVATGYVGPDEAFLGFSSPAVITLLSGFFLSAGLQHTGVADVVGGRIHDLVGDHEVPLIAVVMVVAAGLSAFMPNIAATAVLMPPVASLARRTGVPASRLFMPLAFGAVLGGTLTLVGTPPNIVAAQVLGERGMPPFELFTFTPYGLALVTAGILIMTTVGRRLLPRRSPAGPPTVSELSRLYQVEDRLFTIRVPEDSPLAGKTLREARLGTALRVNVTAMVRDGRRTLAPPADARIEGGDVLVVEGRFADVEELLRIRGLEILEGEPGTRLREWAGVYTGVVLRIGRGSSMVGRTVQELDFRRRYGGLVVGLWRDGERRYDRPGGVPLQEGDEILALGDRSLVEELAAHPEFELVEIGPPTLERLEQSVFPLRVSPGSALDGVSVQESRIGELTGLTIVGRIPEGGRLTAVTPDEVLRDGDLLLVSGEPTRVASLLQFGEVEMGEPVEDAPIESEAVNVVEAVISPRSDLAGRSLREIGFRERYGVQVLALMRGDEPVHEGLPDVPLQVGDALLLQGPAEKVALLASDPDFLFLTPGLQEPRRTDRALVAVASLVLMVVLVAAGVYPIHMAAFTAAVVVVMSGALTMDQVYRAIDWRTVFLVAAVLPVGTAMERSGAALQIAAVIVEVAGSYGIGALLPALLVLSSLSSQVLTGAPTVVMLAPVVFAAATRIGVDPRPLMMGVALAASMAFLTPFSHKANLLVMGAGGYRNADFLKVGGVVTVVTLVLIGLLVPWLLPL